MFSEAAVNALRAAKANPTMTALCVTAFGFYNVRVHYMKRTLYKLEANNRELQAALKDKKDEIAQRLQQLEEVVKKDMHQRDAFIRKMELQNVEQTRSVDRLQHTLRSCSTTGHIAAAQNSAQQVLSAHQQQQQQQQHQQPAVTIETPAGSPPPSITIVEVVAPASPAVATNDTTAATATAPSVSTAKIGSDFIANNTNNSNSGINAGLDEVVVLQPIDRLEQMRNRIVQTGGEAAPLPIGPSTVVPIAENAVMGIEAPARGEIVVVGSEGKSA